MATVDNVQAVFVTRFSCQTSAAASQALADLSFFEEINEYSSSRRVTKAARIKAGPAVRKLHTRRDQRLSSRPRRHHRTRTFDFARRRVRGHTDYPHAPPRNGGDTSLVDDLAHRRRI